MQNKLHQSRRLQQGKSAAARFGFEMLESRQFMSASPLAAPLAAPLGSLGTVHVAAITATKTPVAVNATTAHGAVQTASPSAISTVAGGTVVTTPPPGNGVSAARSVWGAIKGAAKWVGKHVVIGLNKIGVKGTF